LSCCCKNLQVYIDSSNVDDYLVGSITAPAADPNAGEVYYRLMSRFMSNQSRYTLDRLLGKLSCPLLLLWGDLDPWVGPAKAARIQEFSCTCRLATARTTRRRSKPTGRCSSGSRLSTPAPSRPSPASRPSDSDRSGVRGLAYIH
jgi:hypothetical protein